MNLKEELTSLIGSDSVSDEAEILEIDHAGGILVLHLEKHRMTARAPADLLDLPAGGCGVKGQLAGLAQVPG